MPISIPTPDELARMGWRQRQQAEKTAAAELVRIIGDRAAAEAARVAKKRAAIEAERRAIGAERARKRNESDWGRAVMAEAKRLEAGGALDN